MGAKKPCIEQGCSAPADGPRCPAHQREWEAARGSRHDRGYGAEHDRIRRRLIRAWGIARAKGQVWYCPRCGRPLVRGQKVDADHYGESLAQNPSAVADRLAHAGCNRGARPSTSLQDQ